MPALWEQDRNDADAANGFLTDWAPLDAATPTPLTGPHTDHSTGAAGGISMYVEDSANDHAQVGLWTPWLDLAGGQPYELSFWYHSRNDSLPFEEPSYSKLSVDALRADGVLFAGIWELAEPDGSAWHQTVVSLSTLLGGAESVFRFRFRVDNDNAAASQEGVHDIAIDDVGITRAQQPGTGEDFRLGSIVNAEGGEDSPVEEVVAGDQLELTLRSPLGTFDGLLAPSGRPALLGGRCTELDSARPLHEPRRPAPGLRSLRRQHRGCSGAGCPRSCRPTAGRLHDPARGNANQSSRAGFARHAERGQWHLCHDARP